MCKTNMSLGVQGALRKRLAALAWRDIDLFDHRIRLVDALMRHQHPGWSPAFRWAYLQAHYCDYTYFYEQAYRHARIYSLPEAVMFRIRRVLARHGAPLDLAPGIHAHLFAPEGRA